MIRERITETLTSVKGDLKSVAKAVFWATLGSMATLYVAAPGAAMTGQLLPMEIGLLVGMALVYLGYGRDQP